MTDDELESPTSDDLELMLMNEDATSILAAFADLRAERDAALERERVLREDMTGISNLDKEMYIGGALAMLAINIAKRALVVKP